MRPVIAMSKGPLKHSRGVGGSAPKARPTTPGGGAAALSSRLDKWTNYVQPHWGKKRPAYRAVIRDYGQGDVEETVTIARPQRKRAGSHRTEAKEAATADELAENRKRAIARAKTTIRRTIMSANLDHLFTATYRENMQDRNRAWKDYGKFVRLVKRALPKGTFPFVAVLELQDRGAYHIHAALRGRQNIPLLRAIWHEVIGGADRGNIDVQYFRGQRSRLAKYLAKYLSKDLEEGGRGFHRYKRSRGIKVPEEVILLPYDAALDAELIAHFEARGAKVKFHRNNLSHDGAKWLWACSW